MDLDAFAQQFDRQLAKARENIVTVHNRIYERDLPVMIDLMMMVHGWASPSVQPFHADLLKQAEQNILLDAVTQFRELVKLLDDAAATAQATLQTIHDQQPKPAEEASAA